MRAMQPSHRPAGGRSPAACEGSRLSGTGAMTGPTKTTSASGSRFYTWRNENYYSVTTIISGGLPKQALIYWSANQVAEYVCDNLSKVTMLLRPEADTDEARTKARDETYDFLKRTPWRARDKAADLGTAINESTEAYVLGKP